MVEVKNVRGYEGLYLIDSLGNVVSLPKIQGRRLHNKYKILTVKVNRLGYCEVALTRDGYTRTMLLHRLIAEHFVPNPDGLPCVNHKNGVKSDNRIENLEWCTVSQNTKHAFDNNLGNFKSTAMGRLDKWNAEHGYVKVVIEKDGQEYSFGSTREAAEFLNAPRDAVGDAIRRGQKCRGYRVYGSKRSDFANGEASQG